MYLPVSARDARIACNALSGPSRRDRLFNADASYDRARMSRSASSRLQAPWLLIAPSLVLALFIISYPIFNIVWQSLHEVSRFGAIRDFTGLENFTTVFSDPVFLAAARRTVVWTV